MFGLWTAFAQPAANGSAAAPPQTGIDQPAIVVPADRQDVTAKVVLRGLDAEPAPGDLSAGLLTSVQYPGVLVRPQVTLLGKKGEFTELKIDGLVPFGDSSAPLLYKGRQIEVLRFSKPGLAAKPATGDALVARENEPFLIVLENPSTFEYSAVRARLRFENADACLFHPDQFNSASSKQRAATQGLWQRLAAWWDGLGTHREPNEDGCNSNLDWTPFTIPRYAQVTVRTIPNRYWFRDPDTGYPKSGKRKGWLTLRYQGDGSPAIYEQNIPLEVQFEPGGETVSWALAKIGLLLLFGALVSLLLRVSVPNVKRKRQLKDELIELARLTATISNEVPSNLRVLLRVERRTLDEIRMQVWPVFPSYSSYADKVEQGLPVLRKHIELVRNLDAAMIRKRAMIEQGAAPTRVAQVEEILDAVADTLQQDHLSDEDRVSVNQQLNVAQKLLREPTQTEKEAFEAMLIGRWKTIRDHFGLEQDGSLKIPESLKGSDESMGMDSCFPSAALLPDRAKDPEGAEWVKSVGVQRADLQLSALLLLWEFQFLAPNVAMPADSTDRWVKRWVQARHDLSRLLATPTVNNLRDARMLLRRLAEGVSEEDIVEALNAGEAFLLMDPSVARPDQKIRFGVRFRQENLNAAAARKLISCHWKFEDHYAFLSGFQKLKQLLGRPLQTQPRQEANALWEDGWDVYHYFEKETVDSEISVNFHDSKAQPIQLKPSRQEDGEVLWPKRIERPRPSRRGPEKWSRVWLELIQLLAALLVPLAALASATLNGGSTGHWWELVALGFGSDTIKNILVGREDSSTPAQTASK